MKLVNLKASSEDGCCAPMPMERYGYGLRIYLCDDDCEKPGITKAMRAGTEVALQAKAIVVSATESLEADGDDKGNDISVSLQITDMGLSVGGVLRNAAATLYGD